VELVVSWGGGASCGAGCRVGVGLVVSWERGGSGASLDNHRCCSSQLRTSPTPPCKLGVGVGLVGSWELSVGVAKM